MQTNRTRYKGKSIAQHLLWLKSMVKIYGFSNHSIDPKIFCLESWLMSSPIHLHDRKVPDEYRMYSNNTSIVELKLYCSPLHGHIVNAGIIHFQMMICMIRIAVDRFYSSKGYKISPWFNIITGNCFIQQIGEHVFYFLLVKYSLFFYYIGILLFCFRVTNPTQK